MEVFANKFASIVSTTVMFEDGDWETLSSFTQQSTCSNPIAIEAQATDTGSAEYTHIDLIMGFYCRNEEQEPNDIHTECIFRLKLPLCLCLNFGN